MMGNFTLLESVCITHNVCYICSWVLHVIERRPLKMLLQENFTTFICSMLKYPLHKFPIQTMGAKKTMYFINAFPFHNVDVYSVD